jgi:hypothetical protein
MADETTIVVPAALARAYQAARSQGRRAAAIRAIMDDRDVWGDLCEDCCTVMETQKDRAEAVQYALVQAMDLRCPCKQDLVAHLARQLSCDEILEGACKRCGAKIVVEGVKE